MCLHAMSFVTGGNKFSCIHCSMLQGEVRKDASDHWISKLLAFSFLFVVYSQFQFLYSLFMLHALKRLALQ